MTVSLMTYSMFKLIHNLHAKASSVCDVSISRANVNNQGCCTLHVSCRSSWCFVLILCSCFGENVHSCCSPRQGCARPFSRRRRMILCTGGCLVSERAGVRGSHWPQSSAWDRLSSHQCEMENVELQCERKR